MKSCHSAAGFLDGGDSITREFHEHLRNSEDMAVAVAAIKTLTTFITRSKAQTMMGLEKELKEAAASLMRCGSCI